MAQTTVSDLPDVCYEFKIIAPSTWELWMWSNGVARELGETSMDLNTGTGTWNEVKVKTQNDSVYLSVNDEEVKSFKNSNYIDHGLYLVVDDQKDDTVYFRDLQWVE